MPVLTFINIYFYFVTKILEKLFKGVHICSNWSAFCLEISLVFFIDFVLVLLTIIKSPCFNIEKSKILQGTYLR